MRARFTPPTLSLRAEGEAIQMRPRGSGSRRSARDDAKSLWLKAVGPVLFLALAFASGARAEVTTLEETRVEKIDGGWERVAVDVQGRLRSFDPHNAEFDKLSDDYDEGLSYRLQATLLRPPRTGGVLFVDAGDNRALVDVARRRGMSVLLLPTADAKAAPTSLQRLMLRDIAAYFRKTGRAKIVLGRGDIGGFAGARRNEDESGARAFDALLLQGVSELEPFDARMPLTIEVVGSEDYWREKPPNEKDSLRRRRFFVAGAGANAARPPFCAAPVNERSITPALRALFVALADWAETGVTPPPSRTAEKSLVRADSLVWPALPVFAGAPKDARRVPVIDVDGNETSGLRLPDQALPLATYAPWNARRDAPGRSCGFGADLPFAPDKVEREKTGDPRLSLTERYGSRTYYVATVRVVADKLVKERLLLHEDADAYVAAAKRAPF